MKYLKIAGVLRVLFLDPIRGLTPPDPIQENRKNFLCVEKIRDTLNRNLFYYVIVTFAFFYVNLYLDLVS